MKIINTNSATYTIDLIPRSNFTSSTLDFELYDETTRVAETLSSSVFYFIDGILTWEFVPADFSTITFTENETYQLKISDNGDVLYRGKVLVTTQTPQDFKLTDGLYTYN